MYAIVEIGGKQFRAEKDKRLKVPLLQADTGKKVQFDRVLVVEDDTGNVSIGTPLLKNNAVTAEVIEHGRDKKIIVFHKKRRKGYQKKNGHRQSYTIIEVKTIGQAMAVKEEKPASKTNAAPKTVEARKKPGKDGDKPVAAKTAVAKKKPGKDGSVPAATKETAPKKAAATKSASKPKAPAKKSPAKKKSEDVSKDKEK
jgi:large subunit ribosomal protein L21